VRHLGQRNFGDVELVLADQLQQQVERALEVGQVDGEAARVACALLSAVGINRFGRSVDSIVRRWAHRFGVVARRAGSHYSDLSRARISRARLRYDSAALEVGARAVIGWPATVVSGKRTVRLITVWNTLSP